jgi:hypothetical protein
LAAGQTVLSDDLDQEDPGAVDGTCYAEQGGRREPVQATAPVRREGTASNHAGEKRDAAHGGPRHRPQQRVSAARTGSMAGPLSMWSRLIDTATNSSPASAAAAPVMAAKNVAHAAGSYPCEASLS